MRFGVCTSISCSAALAAQGWDFVEENVQSYLQGEKAAWDAPRASFPIYSANCLVPGSLKITGPDADLGKLEQYMTRVVNRAASVGMRVLVFGSGGARQIPNGFDRGQARIQVIEFGKLCGRLAAARGITIVAEHLRQAECNILNTVAEAAALVRDVAHPNFQCLVDSYHLWSEKEPLTDVADAIKCIRHVHVADLDGRLAPGLSGQADYRSLFRILRSGGYDSAMSVEASNFDIERNGAKVLAFLKEQWSSAV